MTDKVDEFESIFKRAAKERFHYQAPTIERIVLVSDLPADASRVLLERVQTFLSVLAAGVQSWEIIDGEGFWTKDGLFEELSRQRADLIISERNLKQADKNTPHSLGSILDSLTQEIPTPVLVLPNATQREQPGVLAGTSNVMVITDHLTADDRLINAAVALTAANGDLHLCHVEDDTVFARYMAVIERIPSIDSAQAVTEIRAQLLREPTDYIQSCIEIMGDTAFTGRIHAHVLMGRTLADYQRLMESHDTDLLVFNTKEEDQLAMHGQAYAVAVEFRDIPLLML